MPPNNKNRKYVYFQNVAQTWSGMGNVTYTENTY